MMFDSLVSKLTSFTPLGICSLLIFSCSSFAEQAYDRDLQLPAGFEINIFAKNLNAPRMLAFDKNGQLFVSSAKSGQLYRLQDTNKDGTADTVAVIIKNLNAPNGIAIDASDTVYIANQDSVVTLNTKQNTIINTKPLIGNLPDGGHTLKSLKIGPDNHLYMNVGSSCNVCNESDPLRATILRYTLNGKPAGSIETLGRHAPNPTWVRGLRNSQGFDWHPTTGAMYATNNGSDMRSDTKNGKVNDELPPEHLNKIEAGKHYGWPHCWGDTTNIGSMIEDPNFAAGNDFCKTTAAPAITFTSHATPIGITFLANTNWPAEYKNDAIVALHGSWNRAQLSGYKLVRVKFKDDKPSEVVDFVTGWLNNSDDDKAWGRPVDVVVGPDGALYVSDDRAGNIYRISYQTK